MASRLEKGIVYVEADATQLRFSWRPGVTAVETPINSEEERLGKARAIVTRAEEEDEQIFLCEGAVRKFLGIHGQKLASSPYQDREENKFGVMSADEESTAIRDIAHALCEETVPRNVVERWALEVAMESGGFSSPGEGNDWRNRFMDAFSTFAERNLGLASSDIPTDPFLVKPDDSPVPPASNRL